MDNVVLGSCLLRRDSLRMLVQRPFAPRAALSALQHHEGEPLTLTVLFFHSCITELFSPPTVDANHEYRRIRRVGHDDRPRLDVFPFPFSLLTAWVSKTSAFLVISAPLTAQISIDLRSISHQLLLHTRH